MFPPDDDAQHSDAAWTLARQIIRDSPSADWPVLPASIPPGLATEVRCLLNEMFFYAAIFTAATMEASAGGDGLLFRFPTVVPYADVSRFVSFETLLPFAGDRDVSTSEARAMAERFRGLAALCDRVADRSRR